jgi:hypothetical protein
VQVPPSATHLFAAASSGAAASSAAGSDGAGSAAGAGSVEGSGEVVLCLGSHARPRQERDVAMTRRVFEFM